MQNYKILAVDDSKDIHLLVQKALKGTAELYFAIDKSEMHKHLSANNIDLILMDIMMSGENGYQITQELKADSKTKTIPIIFLSAKAEVFDRVIAFSSGGDDYLSKPFDPIELRARVEAKLRWKSSVDTKDSNSEKILEGAGIELNPKSGRSFLSVNDKQQEIELTKIEYLLLKMFLSHPDQVLSRQLILDEVWQGEYNVTDRTVDTHVSKLRKKLKPYDDAVESIRGIGYRFNPNYKEEKHSA